MAGNVSTPTKKPILISFYAEKGGVGKTTLTITIGQLMAERNMRVLIYDCDAQRSLTAWMFNDKITRDFHGNVTDFVNSTDDPASQNNQFTLYEQFLAPDLQPAIIKEVKPNLYVVPGNRNINMLDKNITIAETMCRFDLSQENAHTGKPYNAIMKTALEHDIDYVLIDLNPSSTELNRCIIMTSDYLIIPAIADFFSTEMLRNMKENLIQWYDTMQQVQRHTQHSNYPLPKINVKFLGCVISRTITRNKKFNLILNGLTQDKYSKSEQEWLNQIEEFAEEITVLAANRTPNFAPLAVSKNVYEAVKRKCILGYVREFHSLKNISDFFKIPVPLLEPKYATSPKHEENIDQFRDIFEEILKTITMIINQDQLDQATSKEASSKRKKNKEETPKKLMKQ